MANTEDVSGLTGLGENDVAEGSAELATNILERFGKERIAQAWIFWQAVASLIRGAMQERQEVLIAQADALSAALGTAPATTRAPRKKAEPPPDGVAGPPSLPSQEEVASCVLSLLELGDPLSRKALVDKIVGSTKEQVQTSLDALGARIVRGAQKSYRLAGLPVAPAADKQVTIPGAT